MKRYKAYLRERPHYGDMIHEVEIGPTDIKYPDRRATFLRNTHYLSRFDGDESFINLEEQESKMAKEQMLQQELRKLAREEGRTYAGLQASSGATTPRMSILLDDDSLDDDMNEIDKAQRQADLEDRVRRMNNARRLQLNLQNVGQQELSDYGDFLSARAGGGDTARAEARAFDDDTPDPNASSSTYQRSPVNTLVNYFQRATGSTTPQTESRRRIRGKTPPPKTK